MPGQASKAHFQTPITTKNGMQHVIFSDQKHPTLDGPDGRGKNGS